MSNDEKKIQPIFQILHIKNAWFLLELAMALVTTIRMRFLQVWIVLDYGLNHLLFLSLFKLKLWPIQVKCICFTLSKYRI
mgnify:CR=1 FL=1